MMDARGALLVLIIQRKARERESTKEVTGGGEKKKGEDVANRGKKFKDKFRDKGRSGNEGYYIPRLKSHLNNTVTVKTM